MPTTSLSAGQGTNNVGGGWREPFNDLNGYRDQLGYYNPGDPDVPMRINIGLICLLTVLYCRGLELHLGSDAVFLPATGQYKEKGVKSVLNPRIEPLFTYNKSTDSYRYNSNICEPNEATNLAPLTKKRRSGGQLMRLGISDGEHNSTWTCDVFVRGTVVLQ